MVLDQSRRSLVQLAHRDTSGFFHISIRIVQALLKTLTQVLSDTLDPDASHGSDGKRSEQWRELLSGILLERVDRHNHQIWLRLGVVDNVEVNELFQLNRLSLHALDHVWEERRDIFTDGHHSNHLLCGFFPLVGSRGVQVNLKL